MEKLSITLPTEMVDLINKQVAGGAYASTSEVLRAAMRAWMREEEEHKERIAAIRAKVQASLDDPRPNLSSAEMRTQLDVLFSKYR